MNPENTAGIRISRWAPFAFVVVNQVALFLNHLGFECNRNLGLVEIYPSESRATVDHMEIPGSPEYTIGKILKHVSKTLNKTGIRIFKTSYTHALKFCMRVFDFIKNMLN